MDAETNPLESGVPGVSLQEYLHLFRRRRTVILQAFVLISVVGLILTLMTRPVYQASAKLLVEGPSLNVNTVDNSNPLSGILPLTPPQNVATDVEVLQAHPLLAQVAQRVGPAQLSVVTLGDTNVIEVGAESTDPNTAAAAPNTLLQLYVDQNADADLHELESAKAFVQAQGVLARRRLDESETALARFKQIHQVADWEKTRDAQSAQWTALNTQAQKVDLDLAALQAQSAANHTELVSEPATLPIALRATNPARAALSEEIRRLKLQRIGLTQTGGDGPLAPPIVALDAQIQELGRQREQQPPLTSTQSSSPNTVRDTLHARQADLSTQIAAMRAEKATVTQQLAAAEAQIRSLPAWEVSLDRLTREHDAAVASDKEFADKLADLELREKARHSTARIIERATVPTVPVRPKKLQSILFGCLLGLMTGLCLALLQEYLDDRIGSVEEANRILGLPSLGYVPALNAADARLLPQMPSLDPAAESYRVLRTNIHFASIDTPARTLLVTSSNPGEGKTTTAANLAFAMALDGKKVILVDADLRRPSLHKLLSLPSGPGLTDILLGSSEAEPQTIMPNLSVITAGSIPPNPSELLNSRTFRNWVDRWAAQADIVIFDSPPALVGADACILASQMDGTVLVVEMGETRKAAARQTVQQLRQARATLLGLAYNKFRARDGSGYYYYYQYQYGTPTLPHGKTPQDTVVLATALPETRLPEPKDTNP